jgi:hypothetical protein
MDSKLILEIVVAGLVFAGFHQFAEHSGGIITAFPNDLFAILILLGAVALFLIRKYLRFSFGLIEILIGADAIWNVAETAPLVTDTITRTQFLLQVAGGVYFIVRGLDNIDQSGRFHFLRKARA